MKNPVTEKLVKAVKKRAAPGAEEIAFLRDFYHRLSSQDFAAHKALEFRDAALRQLRLASMRAPGQTLIGVDNLAAPGDSADAPPSVDDRDATLISIVTDDKPFIIDSLTIKLNRMRKTLHRTVHPTFEVRRDANHRLIELSRYQGARPGATAEARGGLLESHIQFVIDFTPPAEHRRLRRELRDVMADIEIVVRDWAKMRRQTLALAEKIEGRKQGPVFAEHGELLRWMENHNFAFLGYAEMEIADGESKNAAVIDRRSVLGVLRAAHRSDPDSALAILPPPARFDTSPVIFTKSRRRSAIHRASYLDCILIDHAFSRPAHGRRRVSCILGFLAGSSALLPTAAIPHLRNKTAYILKESSLRPGGYAYKALHSILETLPRGKLFQMEAHSLYRLCMTILNHLERRNTRVHLHRNICGHFYSCLVYIPRDVFNSTLRQRIQAFLGEQLGADEVSFTAHFSDSILIRIHYLIHCADSAERRVDAAQLERAVQAMARDFNDNLFEAIRRRAGYDEANRALALYRDAFPGNYRDEFPVGQAVTDIGRFERTLPNRIHAVLTTRDRGGAGNAGGNRSASFKLYARDQAAALSDVLPILENMGVRVLGGRPYRMVRQDGVTCHLHDFEIVRHDRRDFDIDATARHFEDGFTRAWDGRIENDGFNRLILLAGLNWRETRLLRAYYRYLKQIRLRYSEHYIIEALANHPELVVSIVRWFQARFDPAGGGAANAARTRKIKSRIAAQLERVATLDEDRIIRALLDVLAATLRTNYYQRTDTGEAKPYLSFKLDSAAIPRIPAPAPAFEIFVFSPRVEGVHLRGGFVARGGLRWSERPEDFRTEVLGLVKAQRVKNAVIVPVGSKGGFVAKRPPAPEGGRDAVQREVVACYRLFISGLLDLTDNLSGNRVSPPPDVVRYDGDDPYLVVAADKGTATFSDIANEISAEYHFWLGDAFASGGSAGYDHKKMGITA
ncbi:MAG: NAD-glutamate dehydrogenase, partial [Gammaproteobacteria bacterium]|nr:NAD-glutamate dehydrogenase [Gammaproteobacteria bacterium]